MRALGGKHMQHHFDDYASRSLVAKIRNKIYYYSRSPKIMMYEPRPPHRVRILSAPTLYGTGRDTVSCVYYNQMWSKVSVIACACNTQTKLLKLRLYTPSLL